MLPLEGNFITFQLNVIGSEEILVSNAENPLAGDIDFSFESFWMQIDDVARDWAQIWLLQ